ncbi:ASPP2 protein, partial [Amia calva]|nr:ASPP2 protein [Amia calva]
LSLSLSVSQMFLTVYLSNNDQHFTEVPITPETSCRDVVELCKEPGETECYLAEMCRGSERAIGDGERMLDVLQRWSQQRAEVRFFLRHERTPSRESGGSRTQDHMSKRNGVKLPTDRREENGVAVPRMDMTLAELQDMAARQQQQIDTQQQLLASKEQRLRYLKQQDQRQQQASEKDKLQRLRENAENQEAKLKKVRALKGQVEQKRLSNGKLVEEIEQMNSLFQQKQRELVSAVSKVEELNRQLEMLKNGKIDSFHDNQSSVAELDRLYKELQLRNKLNQEQNSKLQQQRESLNKRNSEVATMDKRVSELRDRLWKKKAALQQKENLPIVHDGHPSQQPGSAQSRVAAVGPYIQSSTMPRGNARHDLLVKPAHPDGTATLPMQDGPLKIQARIGGAPPNKPPSGGKVKSGGSIVVSSVCLSITQTIKNSRRSSVYHRAAVNIFCSDKIFGGVGQQLPKSSQSLPEWSTESNGNHGSSSTLPRMGTHRTSDQEDNEVLKREKDKKVRPFSMFESSEPTPGPPSTGTLRKNQSSEDLLRDAQNAAKAPVKVPPPVPSKPKPVNLPSGGLHGQPAYGKLPGTGTFPGKTKPPSQQQPPNTQASQHRLSIPSSQSHTLPLPSKQETPPAATVRPFTPEIPAKEQGNQPFRKPQTLAASSIYSMYTQQPTPGKNFQQAVQSALTRAQTRSNPFVSVYGKPVISGAGPAPSQQQSHPQYPENPYLDRPGGPDAEVEHVGSSPAGETQEVERIPRPLSPTKLLPFISNPYRNQNDVDLEALRKKLYNAPRPLKKRSSITEPEGPSGPNIQKLLYQKTTLAAMETTTTIEYPPYPPPPYPMAGEQEGLGEDTFSMQPPEITGQISLPPVCHSPGNWSLSQDGTGGRGVFCFHPFWSLWWLWRCVLTLSGCLSLTQGKRTNLRKVDSERIDHGMRVKFNPLALLLDSSLEGEFDLVQRIIYEVDDPSQPNDEGITALHNAVCAGHTEIVKFLVQFGVNVNAADSDGWTPLHCAASCNNVQVCKFLVESGAAVFAMTYSDMQTAADKCEEMEEGYTQCSQFLYGVQEKMGIMNRGVVYGLWDYPAEMDDELDFKEGDCMTIMRREDEEEIEWWWARLGEKEGYIPRNLLGLYPRIKPRQRSLA